MLEQLRRNSRSFIIWILFGIIIAVFIVSFGPQANPQSLGCGVSAESAMEVGDEEVPLTSWRFAMNGLRGGGDIEVRTQRALDLLLERELLAQAAAEHGFRVPDDVVNKAIAAGEFYIFGHRVRMEDPRFRRDYRRLEQFATELGLRGVAQLVEEQRRELLAEYMRQLFVASGAISEEEARQYFIQQNTKITADYVKFDVARYRAALELGEEEIARYAEVHEEELKKAWEQEKAQWSSDRPRLLVRHILIEPEKEQEKAGADKGAAGESKAGENKDESAAGEDEGAADGGDDARAKARAEAEAVRSRIAGGADFGQVAREVSDDRLSRNRGGLLGWRPAESLGYGKELVEAAKKLKKGELSEVIETPRGFHIIKIEDRSEKALTFEQRRMDLAARQASDYYARELARRDAEAALAEVKAGKKLDELFERKATPPPIGMPGQIPEGLPPEIVEELERIQREQGAKIELGTEPGSEEGGDAEGGATEGGGAEESGGDAEGGATEGGGATQGGGATEGGKADQSGDKTGFLWREGPTQLAQAGGTTAPPEPAVKAGEAPAAASEELPEVKVERPPLMKVGPVSRSRDFLAGVGTSEELLTDLFENLQVGQVSDKIYRVTGMSDAFVIVRLESREDADMSKFDEKKEDIIAALAFEKGVARLSSWLMDRCQAITKAGDVRVNQQLLLKEGDPQERFSYQPCATISPLSVASQMGTRELP